VPARRIWNQHPYHVTNVFEEGAIPVSEEPNWDSANGQRLNIYRSNPRSFGNAPDLLLEGLSISSPDQTCGSLSTTLDILVRIRNDGDVRVGPGVELSFEGVWESPALTEPLQDANGDLTVTLQTSVSPGEVLSVSVPYDAAFNTSRPDELPSEIIVMVDATDSTRECDESNNTQTILTCGSLSTRSTTLAATAVATSPRRSSTTAPPTQVRSTSGSSLATRRLAVRSWARRSSRVPWRRARTSRSR